MVKGENLLRRSNERHKLNLLPEPIAHARITRHTTCIPFFIGRHDTATTSNVAFCLGNISYLLYTTIYYTKYFIINMILLKLNDPIVR